MIEGMVCQAYGFLNKPNVNDVWYEKCRGKKFPQPTKIPPTKDELNHKRVNYQAFLWKSAFGENQEIPEPDQDGWGVIDGTLC